MPFHPFSAISERIWLEVEKALRRRLRTKNEKCCQIGPIPLPHAPYTSLDLILASYQAILSIRSHFRQNPPGGRKKAPRRWLQPNREKCRKIGPNPHPHAPHTMSFHPLIHPNRNWAHSANRAEFTIIIHLFLQIFACPLGIYDSTLLLHGSGHCPLVLFRPHSFQEFSACLTHSINADLQEVQENPKLKKIHPNLPFLWTRKGCTGLGKK